MQEPQSHNVIQVQCEVLYMRKFSVFQYFGNKFPYCRFDGLAAEGTEYSVSLSTELDGKTITQVKICLGTYLVRKDKNIGFMLNSCNYVIN